MTELFVAVHGQDDNIGDPALRRAMLEDLAPGITRHILVGAASPSYLSGLGLRPEDRLYTSRSDWQRFAIQRSLLGSAVYVSNAGEIQLNRRRRAINRADAALVALIRARGGRAMTTGMGVRNTEAPRSHMLTWLNRMCDYTVWRDEPSRDYAQVGEVAPDWAFAIGGKDVANTSRDLVILSMRGDRPAPSEEWLRSVKLAAQAADAQLMVTTQVERDFDRSQILAEHLGAKALPWRSGDHLGAEQELRGLYSRARLVISDRLHVLVFAATEGAVPLALHTGRSAKIPRTLEAAGLEGFELDPAASSAPEFVEEVSRLIDSREEMIARIATARQATSLVKAKMNELIPR